MKRFLIAAIIILINIIAFGQSSKNGEVGSNVSCIIRGKVFDSSTKKPIDYANVTVFNKKDSAIV
ncbi:MAG: hypothetical protein M1480_05015, partial [Bacteroidetes bacterium]|nr:hypothetical protein [Bacteroidota bacterium]